MLWLSIFVLHALFAALQEEDEEDYREESAFIIYGAAWLSSGCSVAKLVKIWRWASANVYE